MIVRDVERPDPLKLPPVFPVMTFSRIIGMGKDETYRRVRDGTYPVRVISDSGRYKVTKYDALAYLHVPGYFEPEAQAAGGAA